MSENDSFTETTSTSWFTRIGNSFKGIGMGIAILLYFLGIVANLSEGAAFLRVITPFGYTEGADILANGSLDGGLILCGMAYTVVGILTAYRKYAGKDLS